MRKSRFSSIPCRAKKCVSHCLIALTTGIRLEAIMAHYGLQDRVREKITAKDRIPRVTCYQSKWGVCKWKLLFVVKVNYMAVKNPYICMYTVYRDQKSVYTVMKWSHKQQNQQNLSKKQIELLLGKISLSRKNVWWMVSIYILGLASSNVHHIVKRVNELFWCRTTWNQKCLQNVFRKARILPPPTSLSAAQAISENDTSDERGLNISHSKASQVTIKLFLIRSDFEGFEER